MQVVTTYHIIFYKYVDSTIWQRTQLSKDLEQLKKDVNNKDYVDQTSINCREIKLPS